MHSTYNIHTHRDAHQHTWHERRLVLSIPSFDVSTILIIFSNATQMHWIHTEALANTFSSHLFTYISAKCLRYLNKVVNAKIYWISHNECWLLCWCNINYVYKNDGEFNFRHTVNRITTIRVFCFSLHILYIFFCDFVSMRVEYRPLWCIFIEVLPMF